MEVIPIPFSELSVPQQMWVDYNVVQGVITESDGEMRKMTVVDFARHMNVDRTTCYLWTRSIPNFWDLVAERRKLVFGGARTAKVWNSVFLAATVKLNVKAQELWLANADPTFRIASQKVEHEVGGGMADLLNRVREIDAGHTDVLEGEVIDGSNTDR
jgi:hypothetical protein